MAVVEGIELRKIRRNDLNPFLDDDTETIKALAKSIEEIGLAHPLVVYRAGNDYVILSGHKRYEAMKMLYNGEKRVACKVVDEPRDQIEEEEFMLECNICRNSDSDLKILVERANFVWDSLSSEEKEHLKLEYEEEFKDKYGNSVNYEKIKRQNFRPRLEYIKRKTGISQVSNRTVTNLLKKSLSDEGDLPKATVADDEVDQAEKFLADLTKKVNSLATFIAKHEVQDELTYIDCINVTSLRDSLLGYLKQSARE